MIKDEAMFISNEKAEKDKKNKTTNEKNNTNYESQKKVMITQLPKI